MDITTGLACLLVIYAILLFFDNFFKTCAHYPYIKFLEGTGFQVKLLNIKWKTKAFNRVLLRWGNSRPQFLNVWFNCGLYTTLLLLPFAVGLLLYTFFNSFIARNASKDSITLTPIIPGISIPFSEVGYYSASLIVCSVVHELGHALASVLENVNLVEIGVNIWFILPVAYVHISTEKFASIGSKNSLKILCAGIWHNLVLALLAFVLYQSLPFILSSIFYINRGVIVTEVARNSPLSGSRGVYAGDRITQINDCRVTNENGWYECLVQADKNKLSLCIEDQLVHNYDESIPLRHLENGNIDCCDSKNTQNICFEYLDSAGGILELPSHACLPGRKAVEKSTRFCMMTPHKCPSNSHCFRPVLTNTTNLFKIVCQNKVVVFIGLASDIYRTIEVSSYIPHYLFESSKLPDVVTKLLMYITVFSLGLAIMNVVPCLYMDGQYIIEIVLHSLLKKRCSKNVTRFLLVTVIFLFTTLLLLLSLQVVIQKLF